MVRAEEERKKESGWTRRAGRDEDEVSPGSFQNFETPLGRKLVPSGTRCRRHRDGNRCVEKSKDASNAQMPPGSWFKAAWK